MVVGRMDEAPAADAAALRGHDAVVRRIAATVDAILPMRFGSVAPDEDTAARLFAPRAIELAGRLVHVRGHEQMTLRVFGPRRAARSRPPAPGSATTAPARPGGAIPRRATSGSMAPRRRPSSIRSARCSTASSPTSASSATLTPPLLASVYHLVPRDRGARYRTRVARGARQLSPLRVTVSGPWPPYAFGADTWP